MESFKEAELLLDPQCDKCDFKKNVAWILAPLSFWMEYSKRTGTPLMDYKFDGNGETLLHGDHRVFYFGTYNSRKKAVELFQDEYGYGAVGRYEEFNKFARQRVGSTMQDPL